MFFFIFNIFNFSQHFLNLISLQDYSKLHHVDVIVKAALHIDSNVKNTVLKDAETKVIRSINVTLLGKLFLKFIFLFYCSFIPKALHGNSL